MNKQIVSIGLLAFLAGGIIGYTIANNQKVATVAGVVGGAYAGKKIAENNDRTDYQITVKMDSGSTRVIDQGSIGRIQVGSRVKVKNNKVSLRQ